VTDWIVVAVRVADLADPGRGSIAVSCLECSERVWLAPDGQEALIARGALVLCLRCAMERSDV